MGAIFAAGSIAMGPLLGCSVLAIALILRRRIFWFHISRHQRPLMQDILRTCRQAPMDMYPKLRQSVNPTIARVFLEALDIQWASLGPVAQAWKNCARWGGNPVDCDAPA